MTVPCVIGASLFPYQGTTCAIMFCIARIAINGTTSIMTSKNHTICILYTDLKYEDAKPVPTSPLANYLASAPP